MDEQNKGVTMEEREIDRLVSINRELAASTAATQALRESVDQLRLTVAQLPCRMHADELTRLRSEAKSRSTLWGALSGSVTLVIAYLVKLIFDSGGGQ